MEAAMAPGANEATVDDFTRDLFRAILYTDPVGGISVLSKPRNRFWVCGMKKFAIPDHAIVDGAINNIILFVGESKADENDEDAEPQLIAEAIAAFQINNIQLAELGLGPSQHHDERHNTGFL
jgi:hypothetical protein